MEQQGDSRRIRELLFILISVTTVVALLSWLLRMRHEPFRLFVIDVRTGFMDNRGILSTIAKIFLVFLVVETVFYQLLFGRCKEILKIYRHPWWIVLASGLCLVGALCEIQMHSGVTESVVDTDEISVVGHSFGMIEGETYTGSKEALEFHYEKGQRVFEVDIIMTSDGQAVLKHTWDHVDQEDISEDNVPTEEKFLSTPLLGEYTPMSFAQLCKYMLEHPDVYVVTDTKYTDKDVVEQQFDAMISDIEATGDSKLYERIIVQIYNEDMYRQIRKYDRFPTYFFTMYKRWGEDKEKSLIDVCRFSVSRGIDSVIISDNVYDEEMQKIIDRYGLNVYLHTINNIEEAQEYESMGVDGIYSDCISQDEFPPD